MNNGFITPIQISNLSRMTIDFFEKINKETRGGIRDREFQIHFVVDLLTNLVDALYATEEDSYKEFEKQIDRVGEIANNCPPPFEPLKPIEPMNGYDEYKEYLEEMNLDGLIVSKAIFDKATKMIIDLIEEELSEDGEDDEY